MADRRVIVIKKNKGNHHQHHGGSWKVAYADFVTAMMAFFMVMWIMGMDQGVRDLVQGYFQNPVGFRRSFSGGRNILSQGNSLQNLQLQDVIIIRRREEEKRLQRAAAGIRARLDELGVVDDLDAIVEIVITDEGLRIEMMETGSGETFFERASATLKPALREVLHLVSSQIAQLPNGVIVEGHTDAMPFSRVGYSNWELSVDRANEARKALLESGMPASHIVEVRGYADREPKIVEDALDPRNRRISLLLPFDTPDPEAVPVEDLGSGFGIATSGALP